MTLHKLNFLKESIRELYSSGAIYFAVNLFFTSDTGYTIYPE